MRFEPRVRDVLDSWRFWVGVAYFGLAACVVGLFFLYWRGSDARADVLNERVVTCSRLASAAPGQLGFYDAVAESIQAQIFAAERDIADGKPRQAELNTLRAAYGKVLFQRARYLTVTPTADDCHELAKKLGVFS